MAETLTTLRQYVRTHLDLDDTELPDLLLDTWAREGSGRIAKAKKRWPWFESTWTLTTEAGVGEYSFTTIGSASSNRVDEIAAVLPQNRVALKYVGRDDAEFLFNGNESPSTPYYWSTWGEALRLWPTPSAAEPLTLRGYRRMRDWVADGAGASPDLPEHFHNLLRVWMLGQAYWQQDDPDMGISYLDAFDGELQLLLRQEGDTPAAQPIVLGGGVRRDVRPLYRARFDWE